MVVAASIPHTNVIGYSVEKPEALLNQLKIRGRLVIPVGEEVQLMMLYIKISEEKFDIKEFGQFQFVPLLKEKE